MAEELTTMLTDAAQSAEDENRLAGNVQDPSVVDPAGTVANPEGSTPTGAGTDNTGTEVAPESLPPATNVTTNIPGPTTPEGGGSGGLGGTSTTTEAPQQPTVEQTPVAQSDPTLGTATPLAAAVVEPNPGLNVEKSVNGVFSVDPETGELILLEGQSSVTEAGQVVGYQIQVANTGDQDLTGIVVSDPLANFGDISLVGGDVDSDSVLDVGEVWIYQAYHQFSQDEIDAGGNIDLGGDGVFDLFSNTATVDSDQTGPDSDDATTTIQQKPSLIITKDADVSSVDEAGDQIAYKITIENTGNVSLTNVELADSLSNEALINAVLTGGDTDGDKKLDVDETWTYTASYTVSQDDMDAGVAIVNTATVDTDQTDPDSDDATTTIQQKPSLIITKDADVSSVDEAGDQIAYKITIENTGNVSLTNVELADSLSNEALINAVLTGGDTDGDKELDVDETWTYTASYTVTQDDMDAGVAIVNTATVDTDQTDPDSDDATTTIQQKPSLIITKDADVSSVDEAGDQIAYKITIENTGNVSLTNVELADSLSNEALINAVLTGGDTDGDKELDVDETWTYTASYTVTQDDMDAGVAIVNTATVDTDQTDPDSDDATTTIQQKPSLIITKDADVSSVDEAGDQIAYKITIENTGNVSLTNVELADSLSNEALINAVLTGGDTDGDKELDVDETWTYTASYTVSQDDMDAGVAIVNTATVDTDQTDPDSDDATTTIQQKPSLIITKDADVSSVDEAGDQIAYKITIENTGNVSLTNVELADSLSNEALINAVLTGGDTDGDKELDVDETWTYTASYTVTQDDMDAGVAIVNTATVDTDQTDPDSDDATTTIQQKPSLIITKDADVSSVDEAGDQIAYKITIENTGNVSLTNVELADSLSNEALINAVLTGGDTDGDKELDVDETWTYTASYTVSQDDMDAGVAIVNTATVDTDQTDPDSDDATTTIQQKPSLIITKDADVSSVDEAGDQIAYKITIENTGNVSLTNVELADSLSNEALINAVLTGGDTDGDKELDVDETWTYTASYTVTQDDMDAGVAIVNTATVDTDQTDPDSDDATTTIQQKPSLIITKDADVSSVDEAGDQIAYKITIENTGNVSLTNVELADSLSNEALINAVLTGGDTDGDKELDVDETWTYTASYTVTKDDMDAGVAIVNTATVDTDQTDPDSDDARTILLPKLTAVVDDEGLASGFVGDELNGDLNQTTNPATQVNEAKYTGFLAGDGSLSFIDENSKIGIEDVEWSFESNVFTATVVGGARDGLVLATISLTDGNKYTVTLLDNVLHSPIQGEQADTTSTTLQYVDEFNVTRDLVLVFNDDSSILDVVDTSAVAGKGLIQNDYGATYNGKYTGGTGADTLAFADAYSLTWINAEVGYTLVNKPGTETYYAVQSKYVSNGSLLDQNGDNVITEADWLSLEANPGANNVGICLFKVEVKPTGDYTFTLIDPADDTFDNSGDLLAQFANNNSPESSFVIAKSNFNDQFSLAITGVDAAGKAVSVKVSNTDLGLGSNAAKGDDSMIFTPTSYATDGDTVIDSISVKIASEGSFVFGKTTLYLSVKYEGQVNLDVTAVKTDALGNLVFDVDSSKSVEYFTLSLVTPGDADTPKDSSQSNVTWKIDGLSLDYRFSESPSDYQYDFSLTVVDADSDTASDTFSIYVNADGVAGYQAPIALDIDGDGEISYLSLSEGVSFDYGSGSLLSSWISSSDGLLAYDFNDDGLIAEAKEFVFTMWGDNSDVTTDMQALAAYFDSNKDGVLDSQDDSWDSFGVWQDLNVDGIQQEGEFASLADWGIESIALNYDPDSQAYTAADGDVQVYGQMTVSYSDGSTGLAEDMAFAVQSSATSASEPAYPVDSLVTSYLETIAATGDTDGNGDLSVGELAYGLDDTVSQFIESYGYSVDDHAAIQQEVLNELAHELNDLSPDDGIDIAFDATGDANGADVLAALDDHFMDIYDAHMAPAESYDDPGSMV